MTDDAYPEARLCVTCAVGLHWECLAPAGDQCCCGGLSYDRQVPLAQNREAGSFTLVAPADMRDPVSSGRKRAAMLAPVTAPIVCEWAGLKFAGGGAVPIVGCDYLIIEPDTKAGTGVDLHHGPDKSTLNNAVGVNLHRICKSDHHLWHALNDPHYAPKRPPGGQPWLPTSPYNPHDPFTAASDEELAEGMSGRQVDNDRADEQQIAAFLAERAARRAVLLGGLPPENDLL